MGFSFHLRAISEIHGQKNIVHARLLRAGITRISTKRCLLGKRWQKVKRGDDFSELKLALGVTVGESQIKAESLICFNFFLQPQG